ncbi:unnamed protein product [Rhizophagus irregularis]|uniref:Uncharacterized protein n=1 Tax=Rhizophagus irregularis TaxID=588596 RepID=A0A916EED8_9GLOM|nr:unnamed protein product [Rhizophagus irregularis]
MQRTRSFGNNANKDQKRTSGSRQTDKSQKNSKNSKKKPQETKSEKHKKQKKDKSRKTSRSKRNIFELVTKGCTNTGRMFYACESIWAGMMVDSSFEHIFLSHQVFY